MILKIETLMSHLKLMLCKFLPQLCVHIFLPKHCITSTSIWANRNTTDNFSLSHITFLNMSSLEKETKSKSIPMFSRKVNSLVQKSWKIKYIRIKTNAWISYKRIAIKSNQRCTNEITSHRRIEIKYDSKCKSATSRHSTIAIKSN